jgi:hypothetical protein
MLNGGSSALKDMADESDRLGNTISTKTAKAAERFNDNITRLETAIGGVSRQIAGPMIQSLADMTDRLNEVSKSGNGLLSLTGPISAGLGGIATVIETIAVLGVNLAYVLKMTGNELGGLAAQAVAVAKLDFSEAETIGELMRKDAKAAREEVDRLSAAILALRKSGDISSIEGLDFSAESAKFMRQQRVPEVPGKPATGGKPVAAAKTIASIFDNGDPVANELAKRFEENDSGDAAIARQEARDKEYAAYTEDLNRKLLALTEYTKTEEQLILDRQTKQTEDLILLREEGLITEQDYMLREQDMAMKHMEELARIRGDGEKKITDLTKMNWGERTEFIVGQMASMTQGIAAQSKAAFNINKAAAIGQAIIDTQAGAARALKDFPAPWSYAVAGATYASGIARVGAIKSQQFGGSGGAGGGGSTSLPSAPSNSAAASGQAMNQTISVQGISSSDLFSGDAVRTLIDRLIDAQRNGARIVLA